MIKFEIQNRFAGNVQFTAEIDCAEGELNSIKIGLAARWGIKNGANLSGANLRGANLRDADLRYADLRYANLSDADLRYANLSDVKLHYANLHYANLRGANLRGAYLHYANLSGADLRGANYVSDIFIDGGIRSDGYRFILTRNTPGEWRIVAGCRNFGLKEARKHWRDTRPKGEALGDETHLIIKNMMSIAKLRKWPLKGLEDDEAAS